MAYRAPIVALIGLLALLAVSVTITGLADVEWALWLNLACAVTMAGVIFVVYMGVRQLDALLKVFAFGGFAWLAFMLSLTMLDFLVR